MGKVNRHIIEPYKPVHLKMFAGVLRHKFKKAFVFYLYTGCRKTEPFIADLNGKWLTIKSTDAKSHRTRDIELNEITKGIVQEMRDRYHYYMDEYGEVC